MPRGLGFGVFCEVGESCFLVHLVYFRACDAVCCQLQTAGRLAEVGRLPADLLFATSFSWWSPSSPSPLQFSRLPAGLPVLIRVPFDQMEKG